MDEKQLCLAQVERALLRTRLDYTGKIAELAELVAGLAEGNTAMFTGQLPQAGWTKVSGSTEYTQTLEDPGLLAGPEWLYLVSGDETYANAGIRAGDITTDGRITFTANEAANTAVTYIIRLELAAQRTSE